MSHVKKKHGSENLFQAGILEGFLSEEESDLGQNTFHNSTGKKKDHLCQGVYIGKKKKKIPVKNGNPNPVHLYLYRYFQIWKVYESDLKSEEQM